MADLNRVPAQNLDAEASVLSAILIDPEALDQVRDVFTPADCYADANRLVYQAALDLDAEGRPIDMVTVAERLRAAGHIDRIGGVSYIAQLERDVPSVAQLEAHARIIADKARQRRVVTLCQRLAAEGYSDIEDTGAWAQSGAQALSDIAAGGAETDPAEKLGDVLPRVTKTIMDLGSAGTRIDGIPTGLRDFDRFTLGLKRGKMHVVGGRPAMGKSAFTLQLALNAAAAGHGVVFISAEMDKDELAQRALSSESRVHLSKIRSGRVDAKDWHDMTTAVADLQKLPLAIAHRPGATIGQIRSTVRKEARKLGAPLGLVVVDYLQILNGERERGENREAEVARLSKRLMWAAAEFNVALLAVSQLNRSVEKQGPVKRPALSDLRESGAIEQDAYSVTLLFREEYYNPSAKKGELEAIIAKMRGGKSGTVRLLFRGAFTRVEDDPDPMQQEADEMGDFAENG